MGNNNLKNAVIIVTSYYGNNVGSTLQCFAMSEFLKMNSYLPIVVSNVLNPIDNFIESLKRKTIKTIKILFDKDLRHKTINGHKNKNKALSPTNEKFKEFYKKITICDFSNFKLKRISKLSICSIAGSDQIWNPEEGFLNRRNFLIFSPKRKNIAYAPSFGQTKIYKYNLHFVKKSLKRFSFLSCRESSGCKIIEDLTGKKCFNAVDPTLLLSQKEWSDLFNIEVSYEDSVFAYFLGEFRTENVNKIKKMSSQFKHVYLFVRNGNEFENTIKDTNIILVNCGPEEFLSYVAKCKYVITDSYHCTLFSIIFEKNFCYARRNYVGCDGDNNCRINDLFAFLEISYIKEFKFPCDKSDFPEIDYLKLNDIKNKKIKASKNYLLQSIKQIND